MSYIAPIGTGISGGAAGYGGYGYGMAVYRKNSADPTNSALQLERGLPPVQNGTGMQGANNYPGRKVGDENDLKRRFDSFECQTCKNRKYQDGSDDSGVSFQTPTKVSPNAAGAAVRSHEQEHVSRNQAKAEREGKEIVSQTVTIHTGICPECGRVYVSGGTTRTTTRDKQDSLAEKFAVGLSDPSRDSGRVLNAAA
ncbi:MAG: hypothetical protein J1F11_07560 [Oscillospiraceae bacterium]|nr:hypothetical protein [Oscillospiraceae bacterium]